MDYSNFWDDSDKTMTSHGAVTEAMISEAEGALGYRLPRSYTDLIKSQNGGKPRNDCYPTESPTSWAKDHIQISGVCGIGGDWGIDSSTLGSLSLIHI